MFWKDRFEDDGAADSSEGALHRLADAAVRAALESIRRGFSGGDLAEQWHAQRLLEHGRMMRRDLQRGAWARLCAPERRQLRQALLVLGLLAQSRAPMPLA
jgi:hypothetical protein